MEQFASNPHRTRENQSHWDVMGKTCGRGPQRYRFIAKAIQDSRRRDFEIEVVYAMSNGVLTGFSGKPRSRPFPG